MNEGSIFVVYEYGFKVELAMRQDFYELIN
jgi:hypothetical protein